MTAPARDVVDVLDVEVHGHARPQGSMISLGRGRPVVASNREVLQPWRDAIKAAVMTRTRGRLLFPRGVAVHADLTFVLPRPASSRNRDASGRVGDLDKLVRAVLDAVTDSRAWQDDAQVVELTAQKRYPHASEIPGLRLRVAAAAGQSVQESLTLSTEREEPKW